MAKRIKYFYNTESLKYEKVEKSVKKTLLRTFGFLCAALVFGFVIVVLAYTYIDSPKEKILKQDIDQLTYQYDIMKDRMNDMDIILKDLQQRDDNIYRVIFEADPIPLETRNSGFKSNAKYRNIEKSNYSSLIRETQKKLDFITKEIYIQSKSYDQLYSLAKSKNQFLSCIPAIQPVSNKNLKHMASGFGYRIHPIYKTVKFHEGMDFTAPVGTEIYATGDGVIEEANAEGRGFGNHVIINHGFGYQTLYAHMSRMKVRNGQKVKRGQVIGYVGSTGLSTAPHLHYEVHKNKRVLNPINYYYSDLTPEEYEKMIELSKNSNQSFD